MKNLLKNKIVISLLLVIISVITFGMVLKPAKRNIIISDKEFIFEAGFKNIPEFKNWEKNKNRKEWAKKGFNYISYSEMDTLLKSNGFIISKPENYIGEIPDSIKTIIRNNYEILKDYELCYKVVNRMDERSTQLFSRKDIKSEFRSQLDNDEILRDRYNKNLSYYINSEAIKNVNMDPDGLWFTISKDSENSGLKIIAHHSEFKPGTTSDSNILIKPKIPDPMVVIKQREGYVILAHWK